MYAPQKTLRRIFYEIVTFPPLLDIFRNLSYNL